jgi:putative ABC transport system permease protein
MERSLGLAGFRFRSTFRRRWGGYLALVALVGLVGGLGLGSLAGARRTQASFSTFLASTNPSDLLVSIFSGQPGAAGNPNYDPGLTAAIARLPHVAHVVAGMELVGAPLTADGAPQIRVTGLAYPVASVTGLFFSQERLGISSGRMSSPDRPDEIVVAPVVAHMLGWHVGQVIPYGFYSQSQQNEPGFGTNAVEPALRENLKLVGLGVDNAQIVEDDVDVLPTFIPLTPALARTLLATGQQFSGALTFGIRTSGGSATVPAVERELSRLIPPNVQFADHALAPVVNKADRALKPLSIALGVFGGIALLAALLIAVQLIARRLRVDAADLGVLRALGAGPRDTVLDGLLGLEVAILAGSIVAGVVAVALSPLAPLGPVRSVDPTVGLSFDWTVLGFGMLLLAVVLSGLAVVLSYVHAPHRVALRPRIRSASGARVVASLAGAGVPAPGVVGVRMALEPGEGRTAVPVRSALLSTALAVALVVTTLTFASSLNTLVSTPSLYGWNWTYLLNPVGSSGGNVPSAALSDLKHDPYVAASSGAGYFDAQIDGQGVPILQTDADAAVQPPILSGHGLDSAYQVVLGAATMAQLHKRIGQYITVTYGNPANAPLYLPPTRLQIVGTATFPAVGFASTVSDHTSMGTGALVAFQMLPKDFQQVIEGAPNAADSGTALVLVRIRAGAPPAAALASVQRVAARANRVLATLPGGSAGNDVVVQGVQRPAEIVNYKTIGATPAVLVSGLALGAVVALALTLVSSVRQRRRDLALLKTIGFVRRQLAAAVAWQASVAAVVGIVVGIPLGIVAGRWLWNLFAQQIYAVPYPTVPLPATGLVAVGTLVLANVVAAIPARTAARTPTALMLRME